MSIVGSLAGKTSLPVGAIIDTTIEWSPVLFTAKGFTDIAIEVTGLTTLSSVLIAGIKVVINVCLPLKVKYSLKCGIFLVQVILYTIINGRGVLSTFVTIVTVRQVLEREQ